MRVAAAVLAIAALAPAQTALPTAAKYTLGQRFTFAVAKGREDSRAGHNWTSSATAVATVIETGAAGTVLDWAWGEMVPGNLAAAADPVVRAAAAAIQDQHLAVQLDAEGQYAGIRNAAEVQAAVVKAMRPITSKIAAELPEAERRVFTATLAKPLPPETLLGLAAKEISLLFSLSGLEVKAGESLKFPMEMPNPFGGAGTLGSEVVIIAHRVDAAKNEAVIDFRQVYDSKALAPMIEGLIARAGPVPAGAMKELGISLVDAAQYTLDLEHGWMKRVHHTRTTASGPLRRVDTTEIRLTKVE